MLETNTQYHEPFIFHTSLFSLLYIPFMALDIKLHKVLKTVLCSPQTSSAIWDGGNGLHVVFISSIFQLLIRGYCHPFKITNTKLWKGMWYRKVVWIYALNTSFLSGTAIQHTKIPFMSGGESGYDPIT